MDSLLSPWKSSTFNLLPNPDLNRREHYGEEQEAILSLVTHEQASKEIQSWDGYTPTPLVCLPGLATALNVTDICVKDESKRFGLGSFKALGGAYAVFRLLQRIVHEEVDDEPYSMELREGRYKSITEKITVACATDGNHGRSVAWGAQQFGCKAIIYLPASCSAARKEAIEEFGAEVIQCEMDYDKTVRYCATVSAREGHHVVSDTSWTGYTEVPSEVMQGYSVIGREIILQYYDRPFRYAVPPSHIFVQGGVGGLAAALCGYFWQELKARRPHLIVVEPEHAACLYATAAAGTLTPASGNLETGEVETVMAGLNCGLTSPIAWTILAHGADAFMTIPDEITGPSLRLFAHSPFGDQTIEAGESSIAGLAALIMTATHEESRETLGLGPDSRILLINSEGVMDRELYERLASALT